MSVAVFVARSLLILRGLGSPGIRLLIVVAAGITTFSILLAWPRRISSRISGGPSGG
jgi:hypothetical protein